MLKIHKQAKAEADLIDIWIYSLEKWGISQADLYLDRLDASFRTIATNPAIGVACDDIREGYRKFHVREHYIFYRCTADTVFIIRVLGDEMNYQPILQDESVI